MEKNLAVGTVRSVGLNEVRAYSKGISIKVDTIAQDGRTLICSVFQHRRAPLVKPMANVELVRAAELALSPLLSAGFVPMINALEWTHAEQLRNAHDRPDPLDPIGLISALKNAGLPFPRLGKESHGTSTEVVLPFWRKALGLFAV